MYTVYKYTYIYMYIYVWLTYTYIIPKTNIAAEKWWLGDYFPSGKAYFQGLC